VVLGLWGEGDATAEVTPEGYDDISVQSSSGSLFIQVESRRESVGDFEATDLRKDLRSVAKAWVKRRDAGLPPATVLLLERPVARVPVPEWGSGAAQASSTTRSELAKELDVVSFENGQDSAAFAASTSVVTCLDPQVQAISIVAEARDFPDGLAEIIVAAVCTQVGEASDANADPDVACRAAVDIAGIDVLIDQVLANVDLELLNEARSAGICEAVDWRSPAEAPQVFCRSYARRGSRLRVA
jgi:hypothetical protein